MNKIEKNIEIDILYLFKQLWKKKFIILIPTIVIFCALYMYNTKFTAKKYATSTKIYLVNKGISSGDKTVELLQLYNYFMKDCQEIITSDKIMEQVIKNLNLKIENEKLRKQISVSTLTNTKIINIEVEDTSTEKATLIADEFTKQSINELKKFEAIEDVVILENAKKPSKSYSSNSFKKAFLFSFLTGCLISFVIVFKELFDTKIKGIEDIENKLDERILGVIPKE